MKTFNISKNTKIFVAITVGVIGLTALISTTILENNARERRCDQYIIDHNKIVEEANAEAERINSNPNRSRIHLMNWKLKYGTKRLEVLEKMQKDKCPVGFEE